MTTLDPAAGHCVLINTLHIDSATAEALLALRDNATEEVMRGRPGFASANVRLSPHGTRLVNDVHRRRKANCKAMLADETGRVHIGECAALAERYEPMSVHGAG